MPVITISRQYGSGGSEIAKLIAERLGWTLIDNEFVDLVAQRAGLPQEEVKLMEERVPGLVQRLAQALTLSSPELFIASGETPTTGPTREQELVKITEAVINEAVQHDKVVLVGRGAQAHLAERQATLHVYVVASKEVRVQRIMERLKVDHRQAERTMTEIDDGRRQYVKTYYGRKWEDPANYHLVLNTDVFSYEQSAELVAAGVRMRGW